MPSITKKDVERVARLARLGMTDKELTDATKNLQGILDHFSTIQDIDTNGVPTYDDASGLHNITTEDQSNIEEITSHTEILTRAPETQDNQVKVSAVFKDKSA